MYADIIIDITHEKLDKVFQYRIPSELEGILEVGTEVVVPFGRGNKETGGYVIGFSETTDYDEDKIKFILRRAEDKRAIESKLVALAAWMKESYGGTMIQALRTVLPIKKQEKIKKKRTVRLLLSEEEGRERLDIFLHKNQKARARVLAGLLDQPCQDYELLTKKLHVTLAVLRAMEEQGILLIESQDALRNPVCYRRTEEKETILTKEQEQAVSVFAQDYEKGYRNTYLVYGVTGSGKTEVYMQMIRQVVESGKQAIVLIPEIALTYQTVLRFYNRFGNRVSILNSRLSQGERSDQMERVKRGEVDVMIGPRSALFTPFENLGLIVIDEEHETTYKSEQVPRYHARETAIRRAKLEGASVVLGSATPSLEAFYRCRLGEYTLLELKNRATAQSLPEVYTVDMREELKHGNRSIISDRLKEMIEDRLQKRQQIMLFLNRRGYAGFVSCRECGYVVKCPHCDVALSAHKNGKLVCHYCGYERPSMTSCPECGSHYIGGFRAGTQQIEELVTKMFPAARVLRMDMDTTKKKDSHEKILSAFAAEEADILIGTQMIVKGHDFPQVTLVGVLAADLSLNSSDYRSAERTFQLLTQAVGRAGRGIRSGRAIIQTYHPEHYSIVAAASQDYKAFYQEEIGYRELLSYPPTAGMLAVHGSCEEEALLGCAMHYLKLFAEKVAKGRNLTVIGPAPAAVGKVRDIYRQILYLKCENTDILIQIKDKLEQYIEVNSGFQKIQIQFDFN